VKEKWQADFLGNMNKNKFERKGKIMPVVFMKQEDYKFPTDEIFEVSIVNATGFSFLEAEFFRNYIGKEIDGPDGKKYMCHSIMKDVMTEKFYALCQELITEENI